MPKRVTKKNGKADGQTEKQTAAGEAPAPSNGAATTTKTERLIRAIAVSREVLDAAKAYKRATGMSFYQLGQEAIAERLVRDGFLPAEQNPRKAG